LIHIVFTGSLVHGKVAWLLFVYFTPWSISLRVVRANNLALAISDVMAVNLHFFIFFFLFLL
jgi:hypothetical protein